MKIDFEKISWQQILTLCRLIHLSKSLNLETVTRWYNSESVNFDETFKFLRDIDVIQLKGGKVVPILKLKQEVKLSDESLKQFFIGILFRKESNLSKYFGDFFGSFEGNERFTPTTNDRLKYSGVRNFLISLGVLRFEQSSNSYILEKKLTSYLSLKNKVFSYQHFKTKTKAESELGLMAEVLIYKLERKKFKNKSGIQKKIRHISLENVMAGYDIKSYEWLKNKKLTPKYIEVKAVSPNDWKFYWSKNEINKARHLGNSYYLYLVPVKKSPDIAGLFMIRNPYREVFLNKKQWEQEVETVSVSKKV